MTGESTSGTGKPAPVGVGAAFAVPLYRWMWAAGLSTSLALLILGVGAAWQMTTMSRSAADVALVQTALMLPMMLFAVPAGALADMFDRRVVVLISTSMTIAAAALLSILAFAQLLTPAVLLLLVFLVGSGMAVTGPASQSSVSEQVPPPLLPSAIALTAISFNLARSVGPAIGGALVAGLGALSAFLFTTVAYVPALLTYWRWRRRPAATRLPPERLGRAIVSGVKFITLSPPVRIVLIRMFAAGGASSSLSALMPLVSRDMIDGDATTFGILLGAMGLGAVGGALLLAQVRRRASGESAVRMCTAVAGAAITMMSAVTSLWGALPLLLLAGAAITLIAAQLNIAVQLSAPRWVTGRCVAAFTASGAGSAALGAAVWGVVAQSTDVRTSLLISGVTTILTIGLGLFLRVPTVHDNSQVQETASLPDPDVKLPVTYRSGPIVVEIEYEVSSAQARDFYRMMQSIQTTRERNGAYGWSIARDIANPDIWLERFHCPSWLDYLHQRSRATQADRQLDADLAPLHGGPDTIKVRRFLERPYGSVRWTDEAPELPEVPSMLAP